MPRFHSCGLARGSALDALSYSAASLADRAAGHGTRRESRTRRASFGIMILNFLLSLGMQRAQWWSIA
jgi:hypothetical protein